MLFIKGRCCQSLNTEYEAVSAIAEYKKSLTLENCAGFIKHLKKVKLKL